jgi:hypothetical protein
MDQMQRELRAAYPLLRIELLAINEPNQEPGNIAATNGRDIPLLQDLDADGNGRADAAMDLWNMSFRDVFILDGSNRLVGKYNLNQHDLANLGNYDTLRQMLIDAAMSQQRPWQNPTNPRDVNNDGRVVPLDVLVIINELNQFGARPLPAPTGSNSPPPFWDTNGDGNLTPADALLVINFLNSPQGGFQGEGEAQMLEVTARSAVILDRFAAWDDRQIAESRDDLLFGADPGVDSSWHSEPTTEASASDDAARISAIDRIVVDEWFAEYQGEAHAVPEDEWFELLWL